MIFSFEDLIAFLQSRFPICPGDLLLTGTPSGVSKAQSGDKIEARIPQMIEAQWTVV